MLTFIMIIIIIIALYTMKTKHDLCVHVRMYTITEMGYASSPNARRGWTVSFGGSESAVFIQ